MKSLALFGIFLLMGVAALAQPINPGNGRIFSIDEIPRVDIHIDTDTLAQLYQQSNWFSNHEYPATFVWTDSFSSDTVHDIGFRFRGNTSRGKLKKSFKVSFNTYISGRRYHGLKKLNLNAEVNDPSMMRSYTAWKLYRDYGVAASRSNHVEIYINGDYYGLYQNCEHINDDWLKLRFAGDKGNLYKCSWPADLNFISDNADDYKYIPTGSDTRVYELKTNEEVDDYSNFAELLAFLHQSSDHDFQCQLPDYFNVYQYLKVAAIDVLTGNWDGYIWNVNNYYLYDNPLTGRFEYMPYDLDNTWGIDWMPWDWSTQNIYAYGHDGQSRVLYDRLMENDLYRNIFTWHINQILQEHYVTNPAQLQHIEDVHGQITPYALADGYRDLDFNWSIDDFLDGLSSAAHGHVKHALVPFATSRENAAQDQMMLVSIPPIMAEVKENFSAFPEALSVQVKLDGPSCASLVLSYAVDGEMKTPLVVLNPDVSTTFDLQLPSFDAEFTYNITAVGTNNLGRTAWCQPRKVQYSATTPGIVINEVMASNASTIADEFGEYDDWIELYNAADVPIDLSGYYLVDKDDAPRYWSLPALTIAPGEFLLVWADGEPEQGPLHSNYSVNASGEGIYLFQRTDDGIRVADLVEVPSSPTDVSWGRDYDASPLWIYFDAPTPMGSNGTLSAADYSGNQRLLLYPNPTNSELRWNRVADYQLFDLSGRNLASGRSSSIDMSDMAPGIYLMHFGSEVHKVIKH